MKFVSIGNHLFLQQIEAVWRLFFFFLIFSPNCTWKLLGVGGDGILYCEKLVYTQMPFAVTTRFLTSSCTERQESEGSSPLGFFFFPEIIFAFQSWIQVPTDGAGLSWPGCVSKQAISLVFFIFPSKNGLKKKKTSVKFSEIPWNAAVTFIIPSLLRLCCAIELGSHWVSAGMWEQGRDIKSSTSHYIPKNSREEMPGRTFAPWKMSGKVAPSKSAQHEEQNSHRASPSPDSEIWLFRESLRACF